MIQHQNEEFFHMLQVGVNDVVLLPRFRRTGYASNQRTQVDHGTNLYIIEEDET